MPEEINFVSGCLPDTRSEDERAKDILFKEVVAAAAPVVWVEKPPASWRKFPIFNQDGSGSCVAQTMAKLMGVWYWLKNNTYVHFSATHIYQRRVNKSTSGMGGSDVFDIVKRDGVTLESLAPSQDMTDAQMDAVDIPQYKKDVGEIFKIGNYLFLPVGDIETVASVIQQTGKAVMLWFYFSYGEWTNVPALSGQVIDQWAPSTIRHSITGVDFTLYQGKKAIVIEDSWGPQFGMGGQRVITEDFFKARNFFAAYPMNFSFADQTAPVPPVVVVTKPVRHFDHELDFGMTDADDVGALQRILAYEGFFPTNIAYTSYFGAITASALLKWQVKHNVAPLSELNELKGRKAGPKTIAKLNELYGQ